MRRYFPHYIFSLQLLFGGFSFQFSAPHKILFIGDSITNGKECPPGFRDDVYSYLAALGFPFEFVGSVDAYSPYRGYFFNGAYTPDFYEYNGQYNIIGEMGIHKPTIVVIHLGSNDFWLYNQYIKGGPYSYDGGLTFTDQVSGHLAKLLAFLTQWHDGRRGNHLQTIFLCQIIPKTWRHMGEEGIPMLNEDLSRLVNDIEAGHVPSIPAGLVRIVDQFSTFTNDMFRDDNHPNCAGYRHMAQIFFNAFKTLPMYLKPADGGSQQVLPGNVLPEPVAFEVTDGFGTPIADVPVHVTVVWGDGTILSNPFTVSDSSGLVHIDMAMGWADSCIIQAYASGLIDSFATQTLYPRDHIYISGRIKYFGNGIPVSDVKVQWQEQNMEVFSDESGVFIIDGIPLHTSVTLIPEKEASAQQNVDVHIYDASLIARHVVGVEFLMPSQIQAADIDGDGEISMMDAAMIARLVVGLESVENTAIGDWHFWPPETNYTSFSQDVDSLKITAVRVGDLTKPWEINSERSDYTIEIGTDGLKKLSEPGVFDYLPVRVTGHSILAGQFTIRWDSTEAVFKAIDGPYPGFTVFYYQPDAGTLNLALFSTEPVSGSFDLVKLVFEREAEAYLNLRLDNIRINDKEVVQKVTFVEKNNISETTMMANNYPNPFNSVTMIPFSLIHEGPVNMRVANLQGQTVRILTESIWPAGYHRLLWNGRNQQGWEVPSGIYFIIFESGQKTVIKRMELLR